MPSPNPLYPALIENSLDLIAVLDQQGTFIFQSPSVHRILGYLPAELVGRNAFELVHPEDRLRVKDEFERAWRVPGPSPFVDYRFLHKNESWRVLESVGSVMTTTDGKPLGVVNSRDISDHRALQEQFRHAQRIATLGQLATSIVHEFQNALQVMLGNLDFILALNTSPSILPELEGIKKAGDVATMLARQLLNLARTTITAPQRLSVDSSLTSLSTVLSHIVGRDIRLETSLKAPDAVILARFGTLEQILVNLVSNARDAIRQEGTITISTRVEKKSLILDVNDDGIGIPLRVQGHIFEPFFTTKGATNGTGLGLSTVRSIVEEAGGSVDVRSAVGCGATFSISWPLAEPIGPAPTRGADVTDEPTQWKALTR